MILASLVGWRGRGGGGRMSRERVKGREEGEREGEQMGSRIKREV